MLITNADAHSEGWNEYMHNLLVPFNIPETSFFRLPFVILAHWSIHDVHSRLTRIQTLIVGALVGHLSCLSRGTSLAW